ncbi:hypothetical protein HAX54_000945 [Datura stramonium]|uniref:Uncharacterized protein n=1 Tax=Datura stramonium TaxID=4076 RepID=A0ABS8T1P2_DATST|nr:hypothetical protein [Datura stramonium]
MNQKRTKPLSLTSKSSITPSMVLKNTCKRKDPPTLFKNDNGQISTEKKVKNQSSKFNDLDTITIDSETFFVGDPSSTMPLPELAEQLGFEGASTNMFNGIFDESGATSLSCLEISSPPLAAFKNEAKVTVAHVNSSKAYVLPSCLSPLAASNFKSQEMISSLKMSSVSWDWV